MNFDIECEREDRELGLVDVRQEAQRAVSA